ncbi:hypothetical protein Tco_0737721 [Tanacetum coccineum]
MDWEEDEDVEPEEASVMGFDMGMDWEDVDDEEPELFFPYQAEGSPCPPPLVSPDTEPVVDIVGFQALSVAQETTRVKNIRLRRELEEAQINNTLIKNGEKRIVEAIEEYEKTRANPGNVGGSGPANTGGTVNVQGCSHKTFINGKPHPFNGTKGVVGLRRWIEKVEQVFEIYKCFEEDKVIFAASTFEGRTLTWWNGNVHTLGLVNANCISWTEFKSMMTTE